MKKIFMEHSPTSMFCDTSLRITHWTTESVGTGGQTITNLYFRSGFHINCKMFWRRWVLNSGPLVYQPGALTAELLRTDVIIEI